MNKSMSHEASQRHEPGSTSSKTLLKNPFSHTVDLI